MEKAKDFSSYYANHGAMVTGVGYFNKNDNSIIMATATISACTHYRQDYKDLTSSFYGTCRQEDVDIATLCSDALGDALGVYGELECPASCPVKKVYYYNNILENVYKKICLDLKSGGSSSKRIGSSFTFLLCSSIVNVGSMNFFIRIENFSTLISTGFCNLFFM